jgi:hypothetical protein
MKESLASIERSRKASARLVYHYTSVEVAALIGAVGFKLTADRIEGFIDIGMAGAGFYFTTISPSNPLAGARWPEPQFFSNLLYANYSDAWKDEGRLTLSSAVIVCAIDESWLQPVPERPEALVVKTEMLGKHSNAMGLYLHQNIKAVIQLCDPQAVGPLPTPVAASNEAGWLPLG